MTPMTTPWHGILVATALPMRLDARGELQPDFDAYADHVRWLAANGSHGVVPNGSLGEYQTLSAADRARVVTTAVEASPDVLPIIAPIETPAGFYVATGFSGHGFGIGPGAGRLIAGMVCGKADSATLARFRLGRFFDGSAIVPGPAI
jgi:hypothetical protein